MNTQAPAQRIHISCVSFAQTLTFQDSKLRLMFENNVACNMGKILYSNEIDNGKTKVSIENSKLNSFQENVQYFQNDSTQTYAQKLGNSKGLFLHFYV